MSKYPVRLFLPTFFTAPVNGTLTKHGGSKTLKKKTLICHRWSAEHNLYTNYTFNNFFLPSDWRRRVVLVDVCFAAVVAQVVTAFPEEKENRDLTLYNGITNANVSRDAP